MTGSYAGNGISCHIEIRWGRIVRTSINVEGKQGHFHFSGKRGENAGERESKPGDKTQGPEGGLGKGL